MHAPVYRLLNTAALPPKINAAVGKDNQAFIAFFNGKSQCAAATAGEDDRNVHQQRIILRFFIAVVVALDVADRWLNCGRYRIGVERLDDARQRNA